DLPGLGVDEPQRARLAASAGLGLAEDLDGDHLLRADAPRAERLREAVDEPVADHDQQAGQGEGLQRTGGEVGQRREVAVGDDPREPRELVPELGVAARDVAPHDAAATRDPEADLVAAVEGGLAEHGRDVDRAPPRRRVDGHGGAGVEEDRHAQPLLQVVPPDDGLPQAGVDVPVEVPQVVAGLVVLVLRELHAGADGARTTLAYGGVGGRPQRDQLGVTEGALDLAGERAAHRRVSVTASTTSATRSSTLTPAASPSKFTCRRWRRAGSATARTSSS